MGYGDVLSEMVGGDRADDSASDSTKLVVRTRLDEVGGLKRCFSVGTVCGPEKGPERGMRHMRR